MDCEYQEVVRMSKYYHSLVLADGQDGAPHVELKKPHCVGAIPGAGGALSPS